MKTYNWINSMNVGDQFLDETGKFIGTISYKDDFQFNWQWVSLRTNKLHSQYSDYVQIDAYCDHRISLAGWIKITPLIKELL